MVFCEHVIVHTVNELGTGPIMYIYLHESISFIHCLFNLFWQVSATCSKPTATNQCRDVCVLCTWNETRCFFLLLAAFVECPCSLARFLSRLALQDFLQQLRVGKLSLNSLQEILQVGTCRCQSRKRAPLSSAEVLVYQFSLF